jgi:serine/threonine-protein kinase
MSVVYKAYQPSLDRLVAVKVLSHADDPEFVARFEREARSIAQLQHPNILPVFDYGEQGGRVYLVMQYVDSGLTLVDQIDGPMPVPHAVEVAVHVLAALGYAHQRGVVHRDVKPANVLMPTVTWPMLADFGIAHVLGDTGGTKLTKQGVVAGTAAYMAPEQAFGLPVDARTDLYSMGVMLFEMLTGDVPFDADTPVAVLVKHAYEVPPALRERNPNLQPELEEIVLKALAKDPNDRYPDAAAMVAALRDVLSDATAVVRTAPPPVDHLRGQYQTGVIAFRHGRFKEAAEALGHVAAIDSAYEDVDALLDAALEALGGGPAYEPPATKTPPSLAQPVPPPIPPQTLWPAPLPAKPAPPSVEPSRGGPAS